MPLVYIFMRASAAPLDTWSRLWTGQIPRLLSNTFWLSTLAGGITLVMGISLAWLIERTDLAARHTWRWLLALPLAVPAYSGAICYIILLRRGGLIEQAFMKITGLPQGQMPVIDIYTLMGTASIISLFVFPYVYMPVLAALRTLNRSLEEAARASGRSPMRTFIEITLPMLAPAAAGGGLLVALYALSDFGTVAMMRYNTFTSAIYNQFSGQIDRSAAAILSMVLAVITIPLLWGEAWMSGKAYRSKAGSAWKPPQPIALGRWRWLAIFYVGTITFLSIGLPVLVLGGLSLQAIFLPSKIDLMWNVGSDSLFWQVVHSLGLATATATVSIALAVAPAYLALRYPSRLTGFLLNLSKSPYALPGPIVGLAFIMLLSQTTPWLYNTVFGLLIGFIFRLMPQSVTTTYAALETVPRSVEQASRVMGHTAFKTVWRVLLPVAAPGLMAAWALVFITAMKELPTAVMLRPAGFDTLPVRLWSAANDSIYTQAALPAFFMIVVTAIPLFMLYSRSKLGLNRAIE
jgi:iron(III) transport system permease protein